MPLVRQSEPDGAPFAHAPAPDLARPTRFRHASLDKLAACRFVIEPLTLFLPARHLRIALLEQLIKAIAVPRLRFHNQSTVSYREADLGSWLQVQDLEYSGRYS